MLLFAIKLYRTLRRAIAGRAHPGQLAWAVGVGVLLGIIPHGNLVAVALCLGALCLSVNHAALGLTALGVTMFASRLDPMADRVGDWVLTQPQVMSAMTTFWALPLAPWTDLNNTIVVGSLLIGIAAVVPVTAIAYPLCRLMAPRQPSKSDSQDGQRHRRILENGGPAVAVDSAAAIGAPHFVELDYEPEPVPTNRPGYAEGHLTPGSSPAMNRDDRRDSSVDTAAGLDVREDAGERYETTIEILRADLGQVGQAIPAPHRSPGQQPTSGLATVTNPVMGGSAASVPEIGEPATGGKIPGGSTLESSTFDQRPADDPAAMDEALTHLLRQLRETGKEDAA